MAMNDTFILCQNQPKFECCLLTEVSVLRMVKFASRKSSPKEDMFMDSILAEL